MDINQILNLIGLLFITVGSIFAALNTPTPKYQPRGSVKLSGVDSEEGRLKTYRRQRKVPGFLALIGIGAFIQAIAIFIT
ncbi:hypothetical protein [Muriicola soli]|uniref:Uncharacterized protein n=1 Tax=Muriicola soli TaxID=2507538 RepID=A0A411E6D3_9FLAO|nr:hypothetical protein [Muriicola soli]QBA63192.1 hypothetical protein EQY75_00645 [Muriicola soli]